MAFVNITPQGDWEIGNGSSGYLYQQDEVVTDVVTALRCWKDDCFWSIDTGLPYSYYLSTPDTEKEAEANIIATVSQRQGVESVKSAQFKVITTDSMTRAVFVEVTFTTIFNTNVTLQETIND